ncbi:hypothetical protein [Microbacterium sp.]|uniref:hypothetical protein n=1 Tax=Microbacterium sp. TaxID=51671 RepID=UPI0035B0539D
MTISETRPDRRAESMRTADVRGTSPFLTVSAAAQLVGMSDASFRQVLVKGRRPGYRVGNRWFVPLAEYVDTLGRAASLAPPDPHAAVTELTRSLPSLLTFDDLEAFFGMRRPYLYDVLRLSGIVQARANRTVTTKERVAEVLVQSRNGFA